MTDYYPLIAKAIAGLPKNTGENRRALYERARTALVDHLRSIVPPLSESAITRERLALEEGFRKVEAEVALSLRTEAPGSTPTKPPRPFEPARPAAAASVADPFELIRSTASATVLGKPPPEAPHERSAVPPSTAPEEDAEEPDLVASLPKIVFVVACLLIGTLAASLASAGGMIGTAVVIHIADAVWGFDPVYKQHLFDVAILPAGLISAFAGFTLPIARLAARRRRYAPPAPPSTASDIEEARAALVDSDVRERSGFLARLPGVVFFVLCLLIGVPCSILSAIFGMLETSLAIHIADATWGFGDAVRAQVTGFAIPLAGLLFGLHGLIMPIAGLRDLRKEQTGRPSAVVLKFRRPKDPGEQLGELLAKGDLQAYLWTAQAFFADERTRFPEQKANVLAAVATVYDRLSPSSCGELIATAHASLRRAPELESALSVCRCPDRFESRSIADSWLGHFDPDHLAFCPAMQAASHVIRTRAMEIRGDFAAMSRAADEALRLTPQWPPAQYWKVRAAIHEGGSFPTDLLRELDQRGPAGGVDALYDIALRQARRLLEQRRTPEAAGRIETLLRTAGALPGVVASSWIPILTYWRAVVLARDDPHQATVLLETLVGGPKSSEAASQLALLALAQGDIAAAERKMAQVAPTFPAAVYVHGLILARRRNNDAAHTMLDRMSQVGDGAGAFKPSHYRIAALRLQAAMAERAGDLREAEERYNKILATSGQAGDGVTRARRARQKVRQAYNAWRQEGAAVAVASDSALDPGDVPFAWWQGYRDLHRLLSGSAKDVEQVLATTNYRATAALRAAWSGVAIVRLLQTDGVGQAYELLKIGASGPRTRSQERLFVLIASSLVLARMADAAVAMEGVRHAKKKNAQHELAGLATKVRSLSDIVAGQCKVHSDPIMERWRFLLAQASDLGRPDVILPPNAWDALAPWPIARLPQLWSSDTGERAAAAADIAALIDSPGIGWNKQQRLLLTALSAAASGRDDDYLQAYGRLAPMLDRLPVGGDGLWLGAARIWFRRRQWARLLEDLPPSCVADLANPQVRLLLGLAHAHAAADDLAAGEADKALKHAEEARSTLRPLLAA